MPRRPPSPEEKEILDRYAPPGWLWAAIPGGAGLFIAAELLFIWTTDSTGLMRTQTANGAIVLGGGLVVASVSILYFMYRLLRMTVYMLLLYEKLTAQVETTTAKVDRISDRVERQLDRIEQDRILEKVEDHMLAIRRRIERDTEPVGIKRRDSADGRNS